MSAKRTLPMRNSSSIKLASTIHPLFECASHFSLYRDYRKLDFHSKMKLFEIDGKAYCLTKLGNLKKPESLVVLSCTVF